MMVLLVVFFYFVGSDTAIGFVVDGVFVVSLSFLMFDVSGVFDGIRL